MAAVEGACGHRAGVLLLMTSDNTDARSFYERLGYKYVGDLPDYARPGRVECLYRKADAHRKR